MDHKIIDQSAQGRFIIERYGQIPFEKTARLLKEIISHPNWKEDTNLLVDLRKVDFTNYTFEDLEKTTTLQATLKAKIGARSPSICDAP